MTHRMFFYMESLGCMSVGLYYLGCESSYLALHKLQIELLLAQCVMQAAAYGSREGR